MAAFTFSRVIQIMRRVISRRNATDDLSNDNELQSYIGEFMRDLMPQEMKNFENFDLYEFTTVSGIEIYTFNTSSGTSSTIGDGSDNNGNVFENIGPVAWSDEQTMNWFQDPAHFFGKWGFDTDQSQVQTGQPFDILFYSDRFQLKPQPDGAYTIRIVGFRRNPDTTDESSASDINAASENPIPENYWGRYIAYGAALDYMYDFGYDPQRIQVVEQRFQRYKALVQNRTLNQFKQLTPIPRW